MHCFAGQSRSASTVTAYLMHAWKLPRDLALAMLKAEYSEAAPAGNFLLQLSIFEEIGAEIWSESDVPTALRHHWLRHSAGPEASSARAEDTSHGQDRPAGELSSATPARQESSLVSAVDEAGSGLWQREIAKLLLWRGDTLTCEAEQQACNMLAESTCPPCRVYTGMCRELAVSKVDLAVAKALAAALQSEAKDPIGSRGDSSVPHQKAYSCARCRRTLFTTSNIVHNTCGPLFLERLVWMNARGREGKLACECGAKLGRYSWAGQTCGCGCRQKPTFCVPRDKVEMQS